MRKGVLILLAVLALGGCIDKTATPEEYKVPEFVEVTSEVTRKSGQDVVVLTAVLSNCTGVERSGFSFGLTQAGMLKVNAPVSGDVFSIEISGLQYSSEYRFYAWAGNGRSEIRSRFFSFRTDREDALEPVDPPVPPPEGAGIVISDKEFLKYLLEIADADSDGKITHSEAQAVETMDFNTDAVVSLDGIQYFSNLSALKCAGSVWNGMLEELDLRQNAALKRLDCSFNAIKYLRTPLSLEELDCSFNVLRSIDLRFSPDLISLDCFGDGLGELDLTPVPQLEELVCGMNSFETLDVSCCPSLRLLDLTDSPVLKKVYVARGQKIGTIIAENRIEFIYKE